MKVGEFTCLKVKLNSLLIDWTVWLVLQLWLLDVWNCIFMCLFFRYYLLYIRSLLNCIIVLVSIFC